MSWRDQVVGPRREWRPVIERCGTTHTPEGWERRVLRDKARQRAKGDVVRAHRDEFERLFSADTDTRYGRRWARAARAVAAAHEADYRRFYEAALRDLGYESHPCSASSTAATLGRKSALPAPLVAAAGSTSESCVEDPAMADSTCSPRRREAEAL